MKTNRSFSSLTQAVAYIVHSASTHRAFQDGDLVVAVDGKRVGYQFRENHQDGTGVDIPADNCLDSHKILFLSGAWECNHCVTSPSLGDTCICVRCGIQYVRDQSDGPDLSQVPAEGHLEAELLYHCCRRMDQVGAVASTQPALPNGIGD